MPKTRLGKVAREPITLRCRHCDHEWQSTIRAGASTKCKCGKSIRIPANARGAGPAPAAPAKPAPAATDPRPAAPADAFREILTYLLQQPANDDGWMSAGWTADTPDASDLRELDRYATRWLESHPDVDLRWGPHESERGIRFWLFPEPAAPPEPEPEPAPQAPVTETPTQPRASNGQPRASAMTRLNCRHGQHHWHEPPGAIAKRCIYCGSTAPPSWSADDSGEGPGASIRAMH